MTPRSGELVGLINTTLEALYECIICYNAFFPQCSDYILDVYIMMDFKSKQNVFINCISFIKKNAFNFKGHWSPKFNISSGTQEVIVLKNFIPM